MTSPWLDGTTLLYPPLVGDAECDVVVAGGGLTGLTAAWTLAQRGRSVVVLERGSVGGGLAGRSGGWLLASGGRYVARDVREMGEGKAWARRALGREGLTIAADVCERAGDDLEVEDCLAGSLALSPREWADAAESARLLDARGIDCELLERDAARARAGSALFAGALLEADAALVDPARLARAMARGGVEAGARVHEGTPLTAFEEALSGGVLATTARGRVRAAMLLLATNAWTPALMPGLEDRVRPHRAQCLATPRGADAVPPGIWLANHGHEHWRRLGQGVLFGGSRETAGPGEEVASEEISGKVQGMMERFLGKAYPQLAGVEATRRWAAAAATTCDGLPVLGPPPGHTCVLLAAGFGELELAHAIAAGKRAADLVMAGRCEELATFAARRFR